MPFSGSVTVQTLVPRQQRTVTCAKEAVARLCLLRHMLAAAAMMLIISAKAIAFDYAPIDCSKADSAASVAVCRSYSLGQAEARMATLYGIATALVAMGERGAIADAQIQWLKAREACGDDASCLASSYRVRIQELTKVLDEIVSRGPF